MEKKELLTYIEQYPNFLLYKDEIKKSVTMLNTGCYFELPNANTDWCVELFNLLHFYVTNGAIYFL